MSDLVLRSTPCLLCGARDATPVVETPPHLAPDRGERFRFVRCDRCDLVYLNPRPDPGSLDRYYHEGYLPHRGPEAWGRWAPLVRRAEGSRDRARVRRVRRALAGATGDVAGEGTEIRALDVGCGRPTFLRALGEATGWTCVGVDTSDAGWREGPSEWSGLELREGSAAAAEEEGPFDVVTLWHVLEHAREPRGLLAELEGIVRPGGVLVAEVPDHASLPRTLQGGSWIGYDAPRHAAAYEPDTLRALLARAGWEVAGLDRRGTLHPWTLWWLGRQVARGRTLEGSLERDFLPFVAGRVLTGPLTLLERWIPLGAMTVVARPGSQRTPPVAGP